MSQEQIPADSAPTTTAPKIAERSVQVKGLRITAAMSDAPRALLARVPLIMLPAAGHSWEDYRPILEHFALERRIFALDWPGFGHSDKPTPTDFAYSAASYAEILAGWLDTLGIARCVLLGNSVGAAAAVRYAAAHPQRIVGLALVAPAGFTPPGITRSIASRLLGTPAILRRVEPAFTSLYLGPTTSGARAIVDQHRALRSSPDYSAFIQAYAALWRSFNRPEDNLSTLAKDITAPVIVVRGALDPIISASDTRRAVESIGGGGHALEVVLPGAAHLPFLQQPDRFYQAIQGILDTAEVNTLASAPQG